MTTRRWTPSATSRSGPSDHERETPPCLRNAGRSASDDGVLEQNRALTAPMRAAGTAPVCCVQLGPSSWEVRRQQPMGPLLPVGTGIGRGPIEIGSWPGPTRLVVGRSGELISTMPLRPWARMNDAGIVGSRRV